MDRKTDNYEYTLFVHGALRRPGDELPKPASDGVVHVRWSLGEAEPSGCPGLVPTHPDLCLLGHIFMDGRCFKHPV
eukprot:4487191-Pyramimonas_sp.AAC.1